MYNAPKDASKWAAMDGSVLIISYNKLSKALGTEAPKVPNHVRPLASA